MSVLTLTAQIREITGKKVKKLRKAGLLPASLYGKEVKSLALSIPIPDFMKVYGKAGETGLVELKYDGGSQHTLISNVQIHPVTRVPLHVEFHAVKLTEKIRAKVPVELVGESPAVQNNTGILLQTISEVEVEALPAKLPEKIFVDVSDLSRVEQQVTVAQLSVPTGVAVLMPGEEIVVKVAPAVSEETKKELAAAAAEALAAKEAATAPSAEGAPAAEVEKPAEGVKPEETSKGPTEGKKAS